MATSHYDLRDSILDELNKVYAPNLAGKDWYYSKMKRNYQGSLNTQLTTDILALYVYVKVEADYESRAKYYGEKIGNEIRNMIWMVHPGGSTAEHVAQGICKVLRVDGPDA